MQGLQYIEDTDHLRAILRAERTVQEVLRRQGIENIDKASERQIKEALVGTERVLPPAEWGESQ